MTTYRDPPQKFAYEDIGEDPDAYNIKIFLNNVQQTGCTAYDVTEGWIERYVAKPPPGATEWMREKVKGVVRIEWLDKEKIYDKSLDVRPNIGDNWRDRPDPAASSASGSDST